MITLYGYPGSASLAPHILLEEAGAEYTCVSPTREGPDAGSAYFLTASPRRRVPAMIDGDVTLTESAAICMHVSDRNPDALLGPVPGDPERGVWYRWLVYLSNTARPALYQYIYPERYVVDAEHVAGAKQVADAALGGIWELDRHRPGRPRVLGRRPVLGRGRIPVDARALEPASGQPGVRATEHPPVLGPDARASVAAARHRAGGAGVGALILYSVPRTAATVACAALEETGAPYETVQVERHDRDTPPQFKQVNPTGGCPPCATATFACTKQPRSSCTWATGVPTHRWRLRWGRRSVPTTTAGSCT